jgi:hypothetical protein
MPAAGASTLTEDDQQAARQGSGLSTAPPADREALLQQWERKIEQAERGSGRFERPAPAMSAPAPAVAIAERRTITITGQPTPPRRRSTLAERHISAQPDRIALWAFLLGLLLIAVAAGTAHA